VNAGPSATSRGVSDFLSPPLRAKFFTVHLATGPLFDNKALAPRSHSFACSTFACSTFRRYGPVRYRFCWRWRDTRVRRRRTIGRNLLCRNVSSLLSLTEGEANKLARHHALRFEGKARCLPREDEPQGHKPTLRAPFSEDQVLVTHIVPVSILTHNTRRNAA
jgi:hypothetical protein